MKNKKLDKIISKLVLKSFKKGKMDLGYIKKTVSTLKKLSTSKSIYALVSYLKGLNTVKDKNTLIVESEVSLTPVQITSLKSRLLKEFNFTETVVKINPELLGGIKIKIGDTLLDYSIRNNIKQLGEIIRG